MTREDVKSQRVKYKENEMTRFFPFRISVGDLLSRFWAPFTLATLVSGTEDPHQSSFSDTLSDAFFNERLFLTFFPFEHTFLSCLVYFFGVE